MTGKIILLVLFISTIIASCKKDEDKCSAGKGGSLIIVAFLQHHGKTIFNQPNYPVGIYV